MNTTTTTTITITADDWAAIHAACTALDDARRGPRLIGHTGLYDAFGGSYFAPWYEGRGLAGLVSIYRALRTITKDAWDVIHQGSQRVKKAGQERIEDGRYWETQYDEDGKPVRDEEGQIVMVRRYSFRRRRQLAAERREREIEIVRTAVRTMLAARPLYDILRRIGLTDADPDRNVTAGVSDTHLNATGLLWLAGESYEREHATVAQAEAFVQGGLDALRASL